MVVKEGNLPLAQECYAFEDRGQLQEYAQFLASFAGHITYSLALAVDLSDAEFEEIEKLAESHPAKRVCDQSTSAFTFLLFRCASMLLPAVIPRATLIEMTLGFEPEYDIYQENHPEFSDKAMFAKEK